MLGLQCLGILGCIQSQPTAMEPVFLITETHVFKADSFNQIFSINFGIPGSNRRREEERVIGFWKDFLLDVEGMFTIYTFFAFQLLWCLLLSFHLILMNVKKYSPKLWFWSTSSWCSSLWQLHTISKYFVFDDLIFSICINVKIVKVCITSSKMKWFLIWSESINHFPHDLLLIVFQTDIMLQAIHVYPLGNVWS